MRAQAYDGYVERGQFYPSETPIRLDGRFRAVLTVLDVPAQSDNAMHLRMEWLDCLEAAIAKSADESLPDWPFKRSKEIAPPINLLD